MSQFVDDLHPVPEPVLRADSRQPSLSHMVDMAVAQNIGESTLGSVVEGQRHLGDIDR
jgi:hypothetical protein